MAQRHMAQGVNPQRMTAEFDGDFVVFLIGMRINKPWKVQNWWPVVRAMRPMLKELDANPQLGCLGYIFGWPTVVQYWRTFDQLESYAKSRDHLHLPAWHRFNKIVARARGDVGVWHETYRIRAGSYETIYSGMPPYGLGKAGRLVPASGVRETARQRMTGATELAS
jgi:Domain of unknown function (DUF4188)